MKLFALHINNITADAFFKLSLARNIYHSRTATVKNDENKQLVKQRLKFMLSVIK